MEGSKVVVWAGGEWRWLEWRGSFDGGDQRGRGLISMRYVLMSFYFGVFVQETGERGARLI